mgnify:CR=1 FL=1
MELRSLLTEQVANVFAQEYGAAVDNFRTLDGAVVRSTVPKSDLALRREAFDGHYGPVLLGTLQRKQDVYCISANSSSVSANTQLLVEARLLLLLQHECIVPVLGMVVSSPAVVAVEYLENGDLRSYLRACRPASARPKAVLQLPDLLAIMRRVASATAFLEQRHILHGELRCSSVLIGATPQHVKLAAFHNAHYFASPDDVFPCTYTDRSFVRWMAPEAMVNSTSGLRSDVWSFGVFMWFVRPHC